MLLEKTKFVEKWRVLLNTGLPLRVGVKGKSSFTLVVFDVLLSFITSEKPNAPNVCVIVSLPPADCGLFKVTVRIAVASPGKSFVWFIKRVPSGLSSAFCSIFSSAALLSVSPATLLLL